MGKQFTVEDIPELPGYITVAALAAKYNVYKGTIYYMLYTKQAFARPYKVSRGVGDERPLILLDEKDAQQVMKLRKAELSEHNRVSGVSQELRDWNRRVKDWGISTGWTATRISTSGQPGKLLIEAYLKANPNDGRPDISPS